MESKTFTDFKEAYEFMNSWTQIKTSYETQFQNKNVGEVKILMDNNNPKFAYVYYKKGIHKGMDIIDLTKKILMDKPKKKSIIIKF